MNIFNSLGSNYDLDFVKQSLFGNNLGSTNKLKSYLENKYRCNAELVYKGREAIELALKLLNLPPNTSVAINGLTCYAVYKAILNTGYKVELLDISDNDLNFSAETLKTKLAKNPNIKVVIIQNTLGYPCEIVEISAICKKNKIFLIEDLAHSVGATYINNLEAGGVGDFVIFSFSQDKIIDGVSGGALIIRNNNYQNLGFSNFKEISQKQQLIDRLYPFFTYIIRSTYQIGIGRIIHAALKKVNFLSNPMGNQNTKEIHSLPDWYSGLSLMRFQNLPDNLNHRREIALIYSKMINPKILSPSTVNNISHSTNVRFPIFVNNRSDLIGYLKKSGIYVSDIWYDAPIAPKKYLHLTDYLHQCPNAEKVAKQILNLPTHQNVSQKQAEEIAERVNKWLQSQ